MGMHDSIVVSMWRSEVQTLSKADVSKFLLYLVLLSKSGINDCTDHTLLMRRSEGKEYDWTPS